MILIVSFENNEHVDQVRKHLSVESVLLDTSWFPERIGLDVRFGRSVEERRLFSSDGGELDLSRVGAVWYRRIRPLGLHADLQDYTARLFAWSEANEALLGLWYSLECFWMNSPMADEISQRKIRQLQVARRLGLTIPETLVTNRPEAARDFIGSCRGCRAVRKAFRNIPEAPRETAIVEEGHMALLDGVRYAPVIFQRYVQADLDLRVTIVDGEVFAAAIRSTPGFEADYRMGLGSATVFPYQLPDEIANKLLLLMKAFGLHFGAIDLRVTPSGDHVFLEVNPAGEYLFISQRTQQPIPAAIAAALERHDREHEANQARPWAAMSADS